MIEGINDLEHLWRQLDEKNGGDGDE